MPPQFNANDNVTPIRQENFRDGRDRLPGESPIRRESDVFVKNPIWKKRSSAFAPTPLSVSTTAVLILAANVNRIAFRIKNDSKSEQVWIGDETVAINNGWEIFATGEYIDEYSTADIYAVTSSGTFNITVIEYTA